MSFLLTVVLENCEILKKNDAFYRTHRAIKILLSSPLSKSNNLRIILHTADNVMIELDPMVSVPHNTDEFLDIMKYLAKTMKLKASNDRVLARVIKSRIDDHLYPNTFRYRVSTEGRKFGSCDIKENLEATYTFFIRLEEVNICGEKEELVRLSNYELSLDACCCRVISIFENAIDLF